MRDIDPSMSARPSQLQEQEEDGEERLISQQLGLVIRRGLAEAVAKTDAGIHLRRWQQPG